ncbi:MAG: MFS transporter [Proteobacteria bacterium]|nr:MFS transporter [Pseudomonadota bacterium]
MFIELSPLFKYRDYRLLYLGQLVSFFGNMLTYVALPYQIYSLTHSSLAVGNIGLAQLIPLLATALFGGALADRMDRRKLLLGSELGLSIATGILLLNSLLPTPHVWLIYLTAMINAALVGFHRPSLESLTPKLVQHKDLPAVSGLTSFKKSLTKVAGPALAGVMIATVGLPVVYFIDFLTFVISLLAIFFIKTRFTIQRSEESTTKSIKSGIRYAMSRQELIGTYVVDIIAMIFGMPMALFPAIAETLGGVKVLGLLYAAPSAGMLMASIFSGWTHKVKRHGAAIAISAVLWGVSIAAFGFSSSIYMALIFLVFAGAADGFSVIFRQTLWNQTIPSHLRGRLAGLEIISYMTGPLLGNAEAGFVAAAVSTTFSVVSGGVLCVFGVAASIFYLPKFWKYKASSSTTTQDAIVAE